MGNWLNGPSWGRSEKDAYKAGIAKGRKLHQEAVEGWAQEAYNQGKEDAMTMYVPLDEKVPLTTPATKKAKKPSAEDRLIAAIDTLTAEIKKTTELREKQLAAAKPKGVELREVRAAVISLQRALGTIPDGVIGHTDIRLLRNHSAAVIRPL